MRPRITTCARRPLRPGPQQAPGRFVEIPRRRIDVSFNHLSSSEVSMFEVLVASKPRTLFTFNSTAAAVTINTVLLALTIRIAVIAGLPAGAAGGGVSAGRLAAGAGTAITGHSPDYTALGKRFTRWY